MLKAFAEIKKRKKNTEIDRLFKKSGRFFFKIFYCVSSQSYYLTTNPNVDGYLIHTFCLLFGNISIRIQLWLPLALNYSLQSAVRGRCRERVNKVGTYQSSVESQRSCDKAPGMTCVSVPSLFDLWISPRYCIQIIFCLFFLNPQSTFWQSQIFLIPK